MNTPNHKTTAASPEVVETLARRARIATIVALACLSMPLGLVHGSMGVELVALAIGLVSLLAAAHFAGELRKARLAQPQ